jgi:hypothetical protein
MPPFDLATLLALSENGLDRMNQRASLGLK